MSDVYEPSTKWWMLTKCSSVLDELELIRQSDMVGTTTAYANMKFGSESPLLTKTNYLRFYVKEWQFWSKKSY